MTAAFDRTPNFGGLRSVCVALAVFLLLVAALEYVLAVRGFQPGVIDSEELWRQQRQRASSLGSRALILVGASRFQLGLDLSMLRSGLGMQPVQLALDGSSFLPVLEGLARDRSINGVVLVDFSERWLAEPDEKVSTSARYQAHYDANPAEAPHGFHASEAYLRQWLTTHLRSYADGSRPLTALLIRALDRSARQQYIVTRADRSRDADFSRIAMPSSYFNQVALALGGDAPRLPTWHEVEGSLRQQIASLQEGDNARFMRALADVGVAVRSIEARGGQVFFVEMPVSGMLHEIRERRFPRVHFWHHLEEEFPGRTIHSDDDAVMRRLTCPDGSHLDVKDKAVFSAALVRALQARGVGGRAVQLPALFLSR